MPVETDHRPKLKRRGFRYNRDRSPGRHWLGGDPVATAFFNSLSIVFPRGEAFFIDCVRPWRNRVGEKLGDEIREFIRQESNHGREHVALNRALVDGGYDTVALEENVERVIGSIASKNATMRLTYTICLEHLTAVLSSAILRHPDLLERAEPEMRRVWSWHGVEEIEHKSVCFDCWMLATEDWSALRRWLTRSTILALVSAGFLKNRLRGQMILLRQDGWRAQRSLPAMLRFAFGKGSLGRLAMKDWAAWFRPGFHPWQIDDRHLIPMGESAFADAATPRAAAPEAATQKMAERRAVRAA